ncbi:MAG: hypothetical protein O3A15_02240 [Proteobacteria bacterium]|jgi:hypothetical protein|nr:hypothetical protein [Pseudomonadota bacterium]
MGLNLSKRLIVGFSGSEHLPKIGPVKGQLNLEIPMRTVRIVLLAKKYVLVN